MVVGNLPLKNSHYDLLNCYIFSSDREIREVEILKLPNPWNMAITKEKEKKKFRKSQERASEMNLLPFLIISGVGHTNR